MKYNREVALKIFNIIKTLLPENFGSIEETGEQIDSVDCIMDEIWNIDPTANYYTGVSKMAITADSLGEAVIKIPFNGYYAFSDAYLNEHDIDDNDNNDDEEDWDFEKKYSFCDFYAGGGKYNNDYCYIEYDVYKDLKRLGYDKFVAETELLGVIDGRYILIQEKVTPMVLAYHKTDSSKIAEKLLKTSKKIKEDYDSACMVECSWIAAAIEHYGEGTTTAFFSYAEDDGYFILNDAHWGNYGYREDGSPCILDFSDFNE